MRSFVLLLCLACACVATPEASPDPVLRLHAHNDYLQPVPLAPALALGLGSIEADIYLVDGALLVGHDRWQLRSWRTLQSMYLDPLRAAVAERESSGGRLRADGQPLVLLVDIKADGDAVYRHLREVLKGYRSMLTRFADGHIEPGAVTVLLSGNRPADLVAAQNDRLCALDGHLRDLDRTPSPPVHLVPWISSSWRAVSDWTGSDELMADELQRVTAYVSKAHAQGRSLRFWGAPDRKEAWAAFFDLGIDCIGTDQPRQAAKWLRQFRRPGPR